MTCRDCPRFSATTIWFGFCLDWLRHVCASDECIDEHQGEAD